MKKTIVLGTKYVHGYGSVRGDLDLELKEVYTDNDKTKLAGWEFAASGGLYDSRQRDYVSCGQIIEELVETFPEHIQLAAIAIAWRKYHLNALNAGLPIQTLAVNNRFPARGSQRYDYDTACAYLKDQNLYEVAIPDGTIFTTTVRGPYREGQKPSEDFLLFQKGIYRYGCGWVFYPIPEEDLVLIRSWF